jgi:chromosome segregation protein
MLKRLELVGFKSFADKTQFDFTAGITAIVGPNGSGKSNVVDAVRWILGEQSAKSLRGGEMADVIFNGSTSRRSLGLAEVTMTFDNGRRVLATDAAEVDITRRVYRSGEGEYLINHQVCRLKDIKELFLGTGAGADAYCIIEQGRVDVLLQSSTRERRTIFEEAAGISRFKAKKTETLRKLERVDQNLQRLKDIIDEVDKQLRSVKLQAAKAQRYHEYHGRLKELRVALGLQEYHQLSERLNAEAGVLDRLRAGLAERAAQASAWEGDLRRLEESLARLEEEAHRQEGLLANARQQIAAAETTLSREWTLSGDLEADLVATRGRMAELTARVTTLSSAAAEAAGEVAKAESQGEEQRQNARALDEALQAVVARLEELRRQVQADKAEHLDQMRQAARLHNDAVTYKAQVDNLARERERLRLKTAQAAEHLASLDVELQELTRADEALQARLGAARQKQADQRQERDRLRQLSDQTTQIIADLRAERSGLASRVEVLEGLERSHEGLGTGVREVIELIGQADPGPWRTVIGMVADLLTVRREYAPLIDLALGERAQRFLVRDAGLLAEALAGRGQPFSGRVSFVPLATSAPQDGPGRTNRLTAVAAVGAARTPPSPQGPPDRAGVLAVADQLVTCDKPELAELPAQLLGRTLIVRDLAVARAVATYTTGCRFVTLRGELLEADGTLTVGTHHAEAGILSRKSELRELRQQVAALDRRITETEQDLVGLRDRTADLDSRVEALQQEIDVLAEQAADLRSRMTQHRQRREGLHEEVVLSRSEISTVEREIEALDESYSRARAQAEAADRQAQALQARCDAAERETHQRERERQQRQQEGTAAKVALAKIEERVAALRAKHRQIETDLEQRRHERAQGEQHLAGARDRLQESQRTMLQASAALARWYLDKEAAERRVADMGRERDVQRQERQLLNERALTSRNEWQAQQEQAHTRELEANELRHRADSLVERLREDYQLDLAEVYRQAVGGQESGERPSVSSPCRRQEAGIRSQESGVSDEAAAADAPAGSGLPAVDAGAANEEIAELRRKLSRLGSVNIDSLQELNELEIRSTTLQTQFNDLVSAKRSLEEIIQTINQDSRRLFTETYTAIRAHFQELFRKLFGGGMADIVLEDDGDILESGIEIIARPPGKELRSISLMSGGEKTLTAVALLLAIFRSKPSPFCILDEVDAALDEANIGRFTAVLREFLDRSQFIIITHSKRTMACADVLYGVTMQESGVSRQVAVRFEDWPEDSANGNGEAAGKNGEAAAHEHEPGFAGR